MTCNKAVGFVVGCVPRFCQFPHSITALSQLVSLAVGQCHASAWINLLFLVTFAVECGSNWLLHSPHQDPSAKRTLFKRVAFIL